MAAPALPPGFDNNDKIDALTEKVDALTDKFDARFDALSEQVDALTQLIEKTVKTLNPKRGAQTANSDGKAIV